MRKIAGPGAVGGTFVDYDAITNPNGTVYTADYGNDVQDELIFIQDEAGVAEAAGTNGYVFSSMIKHIQDYSKPIGELYFLDSLKTATAFDKDDLTAYFNGICLDAIEDYTDISSTNWPDLVTHLRAKALTYNEGITGEKSAFDITDWDITSNVATLTFSNTTAENAILAALLEDNLVHGGYTNWRSITLPSTIGDITAGEYAITAIDASLRTVKFAFVASNNSGSGSFTANFYTNRVPGSSTTARLYEATARNLVSANDANGEQINGLRVRDRMQGHWHQSYIAPVGTTAGANITDSTNAATSAVRGGGTGTQEATTDGTNGTPRTGLTTHGPEQVGHLYIHGRRYSA